MSGYADLHLHTDASDGTRGLDEQLARAKAHALACVAITDHDVIRAELTQRVTSMGGLEVITGVEIKATFGKVAGEILGYFVDPTSDRLRFLLDGLKASRVERMHKMVELCREHTKASITFEDVRAVGPGNIGRPHLARVMIDRGLVDTFSEAFAEWLGKGRRCYWPIDKPDYRDVLNAVHEAGGATALAHPCLMKIDGWDRFLGELAVAGLDAIEVFYPYRAANGIGRGLTLAPSLMRTMTEKRGFLLTGGSDDHGPDSTKDSIGTIRVPYERVEALKERLASLEKPSSPTA